MQNAERHESQAKITIAGEISTTSEVDDTILMAENEEVLKSLWIRMRKDSERAGLKLNIHKTKIMATSPITLWQIKGGK